MKQHEKIMTAIVNGFPPKIIDGVDLQEDIRNKYITYYTKMVESNLNEYNVDDFMELLGCDKLSTFESVLDFFSFLCANGFFTVQTYFRECEEDDGFHPIELDTALSALNKNSFVFNGKEYSGLDLRERLYLIYRNNVKY